MEKIGFQEAARIIGLSHLHFRNVYKRMGVPYYKIGGRVKFSPRELYGWIECQRHNSLDNGEAAGQ
jgi:hypothetical protein